MVVGPMLAAVAVAAWWFLFMVPQASKLSMDRQAEVSDQATVASLEARLSALHGEVRREAEAKGFLKAFNGAVPPAADAPLLVVQVYHLAARDHLQLQAITDNTVDPGGPGYSTIPLSIVVVGTRPGITAFVSGLYHLNRLVTIQQLVLSGSTNSDVLSGDAKNERATISATAYTTFVAPSTTSSGAAATSTSG